jgi:phage terminase large subunit-like protein
MRGMSAVATGFFDDEGPKLLTEYADIVNAIPRLKMNLEAIEAMSPGDRERVKYQLTQWEDAFKANPLLGYGPAGVKQHDFHIAGGHDHKTRAIFGGNRAAKTTTAIVDDIIQMCPTHLLPSHLSAYKHHVCPFYVRVIAPDMNRTMRPVIHQKIREWMPKEMMKGASFDKAYDRSSESLRLTCGCRMDFLSYEMDLDKFGGAALHRIHFDEEPPEDIRGECLLRLVDFDGDEVLSMTPLKGLSYTYRRIYKPRWRKDEDGRVKVATWTIGIRDNRFLPERAIKDALADITNDAERLQREFGQFAERGGMLYPRYLERAVPRVPEERWKRDLKRMDVVVGIDPGIRFTGLSWTAYDRDNHAVTFDAVKLLDQHAGQVAQFLKDRAKRWDLEDPFYVIDPSFRARSLTNAESVQDILERHGIFATAGQNNVEAGINEVRRRLDVGSLLIFNDLYDLLDEAVEYSAVEREDGALQVNKRNDHILDSQRYALMERPYAVQSDDLTVAYPDDVAQPPKRKVPEGDPAGSMV